MSHNDVHKSDGATQSPLSSANATPAAPPNGTHPHGSVLPHMGTFTRHLSSHESNAQHLSGNLKARRSAASYDYLEGAGDEQRPGDVNGKFSYHTAKKPSGKRSYDYLDEDQNRAPPIPRTSTTDLSNRGGTIYFESESDDDYDEQFLDHQIRILEAKKAMSTTSRIGNPGPVGLLAFGMSTILFSLYNTQVFVAMSVVPALGICFGGGTEMIMGVIEWVKGNTFAYAAFLSYGAFWFALVCIWMLPNASNGGSPEIAAPSEYFIGVFYLLWAMFSLVLTSCTLRMNVAIFLVFMTSTLFFFLLAGGSMAGNRTAVKAGGYVGIVCGCCAMYLGVAEVVNEVFDRELMPVILMTRLLGWIAGGSKDEEEDTSSSDDDEKGENGENNEHHQPKIEEEGHEPLNGNETEDEGEEVPSPQLQHN